MIWSGNRGVCGADAVRVGAKHDLQVQGVVPDDVEHDLPETLAAEQPDGAEASRLDEFQILLDVGRRDHLDAVGDVIDIARGAIG